MKRSSTGEDEDNRTESGVSYPDQPHNLCGEKSPEQTKPTTNRNQTIQLKKKKIINTARILKSTDYSTSHKTKYEV